MSMRGAIAASGLLALLLGAVAAQQNTPQTAKGTFATDAGETQALGTIAHQQQKPGIPAVKHVITDEDMPSHPVPPPATDVKPRIQPKKQADAIGDNKKASDDNENLLTAIKDEKDTIEEMQAGLALIEAKVETWKGDDCRKYYSESGAYYDSCPEVTKLVADRDRAKKDLEKEQASLAEMQEKARKAGFTSKQYDPD
jgi:hypothetical protein